ncbi:hypothetical protein D3C76_870810 [compost metagenome]
MGLYQLDTVLPGQGTRAANIGDADQGAAGQCPVVDHQLVAGRTVIAHGALQQQLAAITYVIAFNRQAVIGARVATSEVDDPAVVQGREPARGQWRDAALHRRQRTAAINIEHAGARGAVPQLKSAIEIKARAVAEVDRFPVDIPGGAGRGGVIEGQQVIADTAIDARGEGQGAFAEVAQGGAVVAGLQQDLRADDPVAVPHQGVIAIAGADLADDFATGDCDAVVAVADTDVAADTAPGNDDGIGA